MKHRIMFCLSPFPVSFCTVTSLSPYRAENDTIDHYTMSSVETVSAQLHAIYCQRDVFPLAACVHDVQVHVHVCTYM